MGNLRNFKLICKHCGSEGDIVGAFESRTYDDVDPDVILKIKCEVCKTVYRESL